MNNRPEIMAGAKVAAEKISKYLATGFCSFTEEAKTEMQYIIFESMIKSGVHVYDAVTEEASHIWPKCEKCNNTGWVVDYPGEYPNFNSEAHRCDCLTQKKGSQNA